MDREHWDQKCRRMRPIKHKSNHKFTVSDFVHHDSKYTEKGVEHRSLQKIDFTPEGCDWINLTMFIKNSNRPAQKASGTCINRP